MPAVRGLLKMQPLSRHKVFDFLLYLVNGRGNFIFFLIKDLL